MQVILSTKLSMARPVNALVLLKLLQRTSPFLIVVAGRRMPSIYCSTMKMPR